MSSPLALITDGMLSTPGSGGGGTVVRPVNELHAELPGSRTRISSTRTTPEIQVKRKTTSAQYTEIPLTAFFRN